MIFLKAWIELTAGTGREKVEGCWQCKNPMWRTPHTHCQTLFLGFKTKIRQVLFLQVTVLGLRSCDYRQWKFIWLRGLCCTVTCQVLLLGGYFFFFSLLVLPLLSLLGVGKVMKESWRGWKKRLPSWKKRFSWTLKKLMEGSEEIVSKAPNLSFTYLVVILEGSAFLV